MGTIFQPSKLLPIIKTKYVRVLLFWGLFFACFYFTFCFTNILMYTHIVLEKSRTVQNNGE